MYAPCPRPELRERGGHILMHVVTSIAMAHAIRGRCKYCSMRTQYGSVASKRWKARRKRVGRDQLGCYGIKLNKLTGDFFRRQTALKSVHVDLHVRNKHVASSPCPARGLGDFTPVHRPERGLREQSERDVISRGVALWRLLPDAKRCCLGSRTSRGRCES